MCYRTDIESKNTCEITEKSLYTASCHVLQNAKFGNAYPEEEMINDIMQFNQGLTLWGSSKAIKKWDKWRLLSTKPPVNPIDVMHGMEDVLIQLRKDMGERENLKQGDILKLTINDYDESIGGKK